jgi:hypothetical protein
MSVSAVPFSFRYAIMAFTASAEAFCADTGSIFSACTIKENVAMSGIF